LSIKQKAALTSSGVPTQSKGFIPWRPDNSSKSKNRSG